MLGELFAGRYHVTELLGEGGFGRTYIAQDTHRPGHPRCVLKHLTFASRNEDVLRQVRRLFRAEAETLEELGKHDQIPQLLAYFEADEQFYLVQEFIPGKALSSELGEGMRWSEAQVIAMLKDVLTVLEFVHGHSVIHRDIKPDNLIRRPDGKLVLIDFGAVKNIANTVAETTGETSLSVPIYTSGYGASEQCLGRPRYSSDIYSLGMIAIQSVTGMRPSQLPQDLHTGEVLWQDQVAIGAGLVQVLEKMTRFHFNQRYQSAAETLAALKEIEVLPENTQISSNGSHRSHQQDDLAKADARGRVPEILPLTSLNPEVTTIAPRHRLSWRWAISSSAVLVLAAGLAMAGRTFWQNASGSDAAASDRISVGEQLLNQWQPNAAKQSGVERLAVEDYAEAVRFLQQARQAEPTDPETLIYLNNAQIGQNPSHTIAVVAPIGDTFGSSQEILRGVAQAQDEVNQAGGINGVPLRVAIANENKDTATARELARTLAKDPAVLGIVGHSISDTSLAASDIYQAEGIVMVAPLSSAVQLSNKGSFIFRTMPSDRASAKALGQHLLTRLKKQKVVVFYNSKSDYSQSLKSEFRNALFYNGVEPVVEIDLSRPDFDAYESWQQAIAKGAEAIMLAPDFTTVDRAIQVVIVNRRRLPILAGESVSTSRILTVAGTEATGMVIAVPASPHSSAFRQVFTTRWGQAAPLGWRTILAYDAAIALIAGLKKNPTRSGVQRALAEPNFSVVGAEQKVEFLPSGDRQTNVSLLTIQEIKVNNQTRLDFQPIP
ncbi:MAG TPA: ABC transporter substrate-binding protein [Leptolyngbyaceae cyanobacterium M33_DOE_097]|uniref:non-specific serine/threonine protein kinase n=1 Tax=Oscillatoriales cyanobacterium SpSt-418 TaxID=2282169 RepID=A0A7C3PMH3_9CYAN|nr:ABC transporter substrate-binding protein [Leptolyngbyaceae cyanobacterium M33_DOE_097]